MLHKLAARDTVAGVIRGRAARLLLDEGGLADDEAARLMGLALSPGTPRPTPRNGSRASSAARRAAACCSFTTSACWASWTPG
ncbi:DUF5682 family protein [Streptomyces sp. M10(2022)]